MKAEKIIISQFDFFVIKSIEIERKIGEHAYTKITGYIKDENVEEYKRKLLDDIWVSITAVDENDKRIILMTGIIAGFALELQLHVHALTIELMSGTYLMDGAKHFRSFQNSGRAYMDVVNAITENYYKAYGLAETIMNTTPYHFLLQYQETDWAFIKRVASHFGMLITPAISKEGVLYYIGNAHHYTHELPPDINYSVQKKIDRFMIDSSNQAGTTYEQDYLIYIIKTRDIYNLWDLIIFGKCRGHIFRICSEYIGEELVHTYYLCALEAIKTDRLFNEEQAGCSFEAVVKAVKQDEVQITVCKDENGDQEISKWFQYSTGYSSPDGPAWYCMPEIGDSVRLQIPDEEEANGYVISAVHKETERDRKNPDHKSFKTKYGKELLFTPETLEITNHQGSYIKIIDGEGIQIVSNKDITIQSGANMTLSSEKASLMIAGTKRVDVKQGSAGLQIDDDVTFSGGKFRIQ